MKKKYPFWKRKTETYLTLFFFFVRFSSCFLLASPYDLLSRR